MGVSLAVWSSIPRSGKTVFTFIFASKLAQILGKNKSVLVCCTCLNDGTLMNLAGVGIDHPGLEDLVNAGIPVENSNINVMGLLPELNNVYFIGSSKSTPSYVHKNASGYADLLNHLKQMFDLVIFDTSSSPGKPFTPMILSKCDHALNIMVQDLYMLNSKPCTSNKDLASIINIYSSIYPGKKELSAMFGIRTIYTLPYCSKLQEMKNRKMLEHYIHLDTEYMQQIEGIVKFLIKTINLPTEENRKSSGFMDLYEKK